MPNNFFADPDDIESIISCIECKKPLWKQKILKRLGDKVASTFTRQIGENTVGFSADIEDCPICGKKYYVQTKSGNQLYLLTDAKTGEQHIV